MLKALKVRLYPTKKQKEVIASQIGATRYIYNRALALKIFAYKKFGKNIGKFDLIKHTTKLKKREKTAWLKEIDSQALQQSISNMDRAYKSFFKSGFGFPKFKSKHSSKQSYQYPQRVKLNEKQSKIYLPKVGWVKIRGFREEFANCKIKTVTISLEAYQYHSSILLDDGIETIKPSHNGKAIGLDIGVKLIVADSNGKRVKALNLEKELKKLRLRAKQLSNKKKNSNNRIKVKQKLAKINLKIANQRKDFLHKLSTQYSENQTIVIEDLKIKNMSKSAKGTVETPAKNVAQKRGLNRAITQQSWGLFFEMLEYKTARRGGKLIKVEPKYTSQTCSSCGYIDKKNRVNQSKFVCIACGYCENADINASKNILARGIHGNNAFHQTKIA